MIVGSPLRGQAGERLRTTEMFEILGPIIVTLINDFRDFPMDYTQLFLLTIMTTKEVTEVEEMF